MNWRDVIYLIKIGYVENPLGDVEKNEVERMVYANKQSIRQSEFYQAQATGLKPELSFEIRTVEYDDEQAIKFKSLKYKVIRTYNKGEFIELICEGVVNDSDA